MLLIRNAIPHSLLVLGLFCGLCVMDPTTQSGDWSVSRSAIHWIATGDGLHRQLHLSTNLSLAPSTVSSLRARLARVIYSDNSVSTTAGSQGQDRPSGVFVRFAFTIPPTMYMDMDELVALGKTTGFEARSHGGDIDVERPSQDSSWHEVAVHVPLAVEGVETMDRHWVTPIEIVVPIHLRYQPPSLEAEYAEAVIQPPKLDLLVAGKADGTIHGVNCELELKLSATTEWAKYQILKSDDADETSITLRVPVGNALLETVVVVSTTVVTVIVCVLLTWKLKLAGDRIELSHEHAE